MVPMAFSLMSNKKEVTYRAIFQYIHDNVIPLNCSSFMCDYERAMRNAFLSVVSDARVSSCHFHFTQAVKRNAMKCPTMIQFIHNNKEAAKVYYKLLSLPLLPSANIREAFDELKTQAQSLSPVFDRFLIYYYRQWIEGKRVSIFSDPVVYFYHKLNDISIIQDTIILTLYEYSFSNLIGITRNDFCVWPIQSHYQFT